MREKLLAEEAKQADPKVPPARSDRPMTARPYLKPLSAHVQVQAQKKRHQQQELIAELRKRQAKDHRPVYEGKDGTIEDIITGGAGGGGSPRSGRRKRQMSVVVRSSTLLQCTLCYVVHKPPRLEHGT